MPRISASYRSTRRALILEAAVQCFAANGIAGTTMADIHRAAGISVGGLYRYFPSKQEILLEVTRRDHERLHALLLSAVAGCTYANELLPAVFAALARYRSEYPVDVNRLAVASWLEASTNAPLRGLINDSFHTLANAFSEQLTRWGVPPTEHAELTHTLQALIFGHMALSLLEEPGGSEATVRAAAQT